MNIAYIFVLSALLFALFCSRSSHSRRLSVSQFAFFPPHSIVFESTIWCVLFCRSFRLWRFSFYFLFNAWWLRLFLNDFFSLFTFEQSISTYWLQGIWSASAKSVNGRMWVENSEKFPFEKRPFNSWWHKWKTKNYYSATIYLYLSVSILDSVANRFNL